MSSQPTNATTEIKVQFLAPAYATSYSLSIKQMAICMLMYMEQLAYGVHQSLAQEPNLHRIMPWQNSTLIYTCYYYYIH